MKNYVRILVSLLVMVVVIGTLSASAADFAYGEVTGWTVHNQSTGWSGQLKYDDLGGIRWFVNVGQEEYLKYNEEVIKMPAMGKTETVAVQKYTTKDEKEWTIRFLGENCVEFVQNIDGTYTIIDHITKKGVKYPKSVFSEAEAVEIIRDFCPGYETVEIVHELVSQEDGQLFKGCFFYCKRADGTGGYSSSKGTKIGDKYDIPISGIVAQIWEYQVNQ